MIDLHALPTPNCWKVAIALEEMALDYTYTRVDIAQGDQFSEEFARINVGEAHSTRLAFIAEPGSPGAVTKQGAAPVAAAADYMAGKIRSLYEQLNERLADREYLCDAYSIADMAAWCHIVTHRVYAVSEGLEPYPNLMRWYRALRARPALQRGFDLDLEIFEKIPADFRRNLRDE